MTDSLFPPPTKRQASPRAARSRAAAAKRRAEAPELNSPDPRERVRARLFGCFESFVGISHDDVEKAGWAPTDDWAESWSSYFETYHAIWRERAAAGLLPPCPAPLPRVAREETPMETWFEDEHATAHRTEGLREGAPTTACCGATLLAVAVADPGDPMLSRCPGCARGDAKNGGPKFPDPVPAEPVNAPDDGARCEDVAAWMACRGRTKRLFLCARHRGRYTGSGRLLPYCEEGYEDPTAETKVYTGPQRFCGEEQG